MVEQRTKKKIRDIMSSVFGVLIVLVFFGGIYFFNRTLPEMNNKRKVEEAHNNCLTKAPYFAWTKSYSYVKNETNYRLDNAYYYCQRILYPSKPECISDGREKTTYGGEMGDVIYHTYCKDDGSWTTKYVWSDAEDFTLPEDEMPKKYSCQNVTSYDYNWGNDMYCTSPDGTGFYTSYEGASYYENL